MLYAERGLAANKAVSRKDAKGAKTQSPARLILCVFAPFASLRESSCSEYKFLRSCFIELGEDDSLAPELSSKQIAREANRGFWERS